MADRNVQDVSFHAWSINAGPTLSEVLSDFLKYLAQLSFVQLLSSTVNLLKPTGSVMHQQFNIQQLHVLPTLYLCVLHLSENKRRVVPLTA